MRGLGPRIKILSVFGTLIMKLIAFVMKFYLFVCMKELPMVNVSVEHVTAHQVILVRIVDVQPRQMPVLTLMG